ncbi:MAG TPA: EfeM/EfeO family lipoprotein [Polyangiaceae bacterium]|jgi:iron uptake system component EfeO|nr:EfeM/EfeO family lipoprotein [Polyangiaceae bacterium]
MKSTTFALIALSLAAPACSSDDSGGSGFDAEYQQKVVTGMHSALLADVNALHDAAVDLQAAAPTPAGRGWDDTEDAAAISQMTAAWLRARAAYERTEGALAPLFPDTDAAIDARYEDFLEGVPGGDQNLFDDEGVTGMHAIERIIFAPKIPASVIEVESSLPGYKAAAWPKSEAEARAFKDELCARLIQDTQDLADQWQPQSIDLDGAFNGLISLMNEQREKVNKAASEEEESRYAQRTLADLRDNLAGTTRIYALFKEWLLTKANGEKIDADVEASFASLDTTYKSFSGDAIPTPPATWSSEKPSASDLQSPFGKLYTAVQQAVDPNISGSAVDGMNRAASELGFQEFTEEE